MAMFLWVVSKFIWTTEQYFHMYRTRWTFVTLVTHLNTSYYKFNEFVEYNNSCLPWANIQTKFPKLKFYFFKL